MIYTKRSHLTILQIFEERECVTFAELIPVLRERLSHVVYIERQGALYGIVTEKRIRQACVEQQHFVNINRQPKFVRRGEYMQAKRFFEGRDQMLYLPVLDEDGYLCGEYKKEDELTYLECSMPRYAKLYAMEKLCKVYHHVNLIRPNRGFVRKEKLFQKMKNILESCGIEVQVIDREELFRSDTGCGAYLFLDGSERSGFSALSSILKYNGESIVYYDAAYLSYKDCCDIKSTSNMAAASMLEQLEAMGVSVLNIHFAENESGYLQKLKKKLRERCTQLGIAGNTLPQSAKKDFFGEIYNEEYERRWFGYPYVVTRKDGVPVIKDIDEPLFHTQRGDRITVGQPAQYERCVYLYGPCIVVGSYVEDRHTIASWLQNSINNAGIPCRVVNKGIHCSPMDELKKISKTALKKGDIVVLYMENWSFQQLANLNLTNVLEQNPISLDWFIGYEVHCNYKIAKLYADAIFEKLQPILTKTVTDRRPLESFDSELYISAFFSDFDPSAYSVIGSIVMNCNPFTLGHRWLIEEARRQVDFLIIFVVEEDRSVFTFEERFMMVHNGISDLDNVKVVPSGDNILSQRTFPEYFVKMEDEQLVENVERDITIFAEQIAPKLSISRRFVGEEPEDRVTNSYNTAMKKILPAHGIDVVEIPRKEAGGKIISASLVRRCLETNDQETLAKLVPQSTMRILYSTND